MLAKQSTFLAKENVANVFGKSDCLSHPTSTLDRKHAVVSNEDYAILKGSSK